MLRLFKPQAYAPRITQIDVLGARLTGMEVILVEPLVRRDPWSTLPLRWIERIMLRGVPRV
jgi:predicted HAD superfamily phosphohydrolase YqeG